MSEEQVGVKATDAMVDLESLGTQPYAPVLSIGAVAFDFIGGGLDVFYQKVTLESCLELGMRPDAGAIKFWMEQDEIVRTAMFSGEGAVTLPNALDAFTDWWGSRPMRMWGNSARFDCGLLEAAYKVCRKDIPWEWWRERCYRTVKDLRPGLPKIERFGSHHNALDDALSQAEHLIRLFRDLGFNPDAAKAA